tara:strand:- start:153 stop:527 length:375 start_codon:yes stop_codon:yes gene_type:complete
MAVGDKTPIKWEDADFKWNIAPPSKDYKVGFEASKFPYTWDDVALVEVAIGQGGGGDIIEDMPWMKWDDGDDRKKRLIKLICKVQGKTITEEKEVQNYEITVSDIKMLAKEVLGIEIMTENIKF